MKSNKQRKRNEIVEKNNLVKDRKSGCSECKLTRVIRVISNSSACSFACPGRKDNNLHTSPTTVAQPFEGKSMVLHGYHVLPRPQKARKHWPTLQQTSFLRREARCITQPQLALITILQDYIWGVSKMPVSSWLVGPHPTKWKVTGSIPGQGTCLCYGFGPCWDTY